MSNTAIADSLETCANTTGAMSLACLAQVYPAKGQDGDARIPASAR